MLLCFSVVLTDERRERRLRSAAGPAIYFKLCESKKVVVLSTAAMLRQLVTFVVDKFVEGDLRLLLANALKSITIPDGTS